MTTLADLQKTGKTYSFKRYGDIMLIVKEMSE